MGNSDTPTDEELSGPVVDRRTTAKLLAAAGMAGFAGCSGGGTGEPDQQETTGGDETTSGDTDSEETTSTPESKQGGELVAGWQTGSIDTLDPPKISVGQYFQVAANIFSGLVTLKEDLTVRGDLARDWEVTNGGRQFTFQLREGVTFHNGADFTAEDVRFTINRTISEELPAASKLSTLEPVDDGGVVVEGDYTVQLNFKQAMAPALIYLTRGPGRAATIVSQEAIEEMGADQYNVTPVGTGPFQVASHNIGSELVLEAYDDYFETDADGTQLPYLDRITINPIPEPSTLINAIRGGDIDFINVVPLESVDKVESANEAELLEAPGVNWLGLAMNENREPFDSQKARLGIAKVIDNEAYVETAYFGNALPSVGPINKATNWVWREETGDDGVGGELKAPDQNYAPEEGQQLIQEAGADGASFSILVAEGSLRPAKAMRQQLNAAGFDVDIEQVTTSTYWDRYANLDYDVTISGSVGDPDPDQSLWNFYRKPDQGGVWNWVNYSNDQVHQLLEDQRRALDREERKRILWELEDRLIKTAPHAFLTHRNDYAAKRPAVKGFTHIPFMRNFHRVYLDE